MESFAGKTALITGGASGIGFAAAQAFAAAGADVAIADIDQQGGEIAASSLPNTHFFRADLTSEAETVAMFEAAAAALDKIDILVNNAGIQYIAPIEEFPPDQWRRIIDMMVTAPFLLTRAALPGMYLRKWGRIINIGSAHSLIASAYKSAYVTAKHGLLGLTRVTALEAAPHGVTCNCVCPSYVRTPLVDKQIAAQAKAHNIPEDEVVEKIMTAESPIHRLLEPQEIADAILYLCSPSASGITGSAFTIDCGWSAH